MENFNEHIDYLIIQYSRRTISSKGTEELFSWLENVPENKTYFKEQIILLRNVQTPAVKFNAQKSLSEFYRLVGNPYRYTLVLKIAAIAASIVFILIIGEILINQSINSQPEFIEYMAQENNLLKTLSDSTEITLCKNSVILIPEEFASKTRNVKLIGKAFFEVTKDKNRPFTILCQNILIKVVGTSFEVEMDTITDLVTVTVTSGEVSVNHVESSLIRSVYKGCQMMISQDGALINKSKITNENYSSWKTGILIFENARMLDVADELMKLYKKEIIFQSESLKDELITLKINNQPLFEIKKTLEIILQARIYENNDTLIFSRKY